VTKEKWRALNTALRTNSKADPWNSLAPDLVTALTTAPMALPYSALKFVFWTLNSWTASGFGKLPL